MGRSRARTLVAASALALALGACGGGGSGSGGPTEVVVWNGYTDAQADNFTALIDQYNDEHPDVEVTQLVSSSDFVLQKVLTAVRGGTPPDVAYMFGSWSPNVAKIPQVVDMSDYVSQDGWDWDDFYPAEREAATVDGKVVGVPALVDNLAIVYNKDLFSEAGVEPPAPDWTWDDFRSAASQLTDPSRQQYGWLFPADASEDTVWHFDAMLWAAGGDILADGDTTAAFDSAAGRRAMTTLQQMAVEDRSVYLDTDNSKGTKLMNSGKIAMLVTGPWDLSSLPDIDYGVEVLPSYEDSPAGHASISGPDNWVTFDNGTERREAAVEFVRWLTSKEQVRTTSLATGDLPTRQSLAEDDAFVAELDDKLPGAATFVANLSNVGKARPPVEQYPEVSQAMGQAVVAVLLGKASPADALSGAAEQADSALGAG